MKIVKFLLFVFVLFVFTNCKRKEHNSSAPIVFAIKDLSQSSKVKLSDLGFNDIQYIPLETNKQCLIGGINRVIAGNGFFLVKYIERILTFRTDGSFVAKIGEKGNGPEEYQLAHDVAIDRTSKNIYVLSGWEQKIYVYTEDGRFIRTIPVPKYSKELTFAGNDILCYSVNTDGLVKNSFNLVDKNGIVIKSFPNKYPFKAQPFVIFYQHENLFYEYGSQVFKKEIYSDTIYAFVKNVFKPKFVLEQGKWLLTPKVRENGDWMKVLKNYVTQWNLFEFGDKICYEFSDKTGHFCFVGSTNSDFRSLTDWDQGFVDDLDGGPNIKLQTVEDDKTVISWVSALALKTYVASDAFKNSKPKYPEKKKALEKLANSLSENDNPVLVLVKMK